MGRAAVIGTGHAGWAAASALVRRGERPVVIDVGLDLDPGRAAVVDRMRRLGPAEWSTDDLAAVSGVGGGGDALPRRLAFGSDHMYADHHPAAPISRSWAHAPSASLAIGGLSNVWTGAMLPIATTDLDDWPATSRVGADHYREVLADLPIVADAGEDDDIFPLHADGAVDMPLSGASARLLAALRAHPPRRGVGDLVAGRSRLAVEVVDPLRACRMCGRCHQGCVYGSIWTAAAEVRSMAAAEVIDYRPGLVVRRIEETRGTVRIHCDRLGGGQETVEVDRAFVAAGALSSTRIVLESMGLWDRPVRLQTTHGIAVPLLHARRDEVVPGPSLPSIFLEVRAPDARRWMHWQLGAPNDLVMEKVARIPGAAPFAAAVARRALIAAGNIHSDLAGHHLLRLERRGEGPPLLRVDTVGRPSVLGEERRVVRQLRRVLAGTGLVVAPRWRPRPRDLPISWHVGGSLPMGGSGPVGTDALGRPDGWDRVHVVDSSIFPSIPATTMALLAMANATRIVEQVTGLPADPEQVLHPRSRR